MSQTASGQLTALNQTYKDIDDVYHLYAKANGLSDTAFWMLYSLWERKAACTQRELCAEWSYSPQTVNSALKVLEGQELIHLVQSPENRRNKQILFTPKGIAVGERVIAPLLQAERRSFSELSEQERAELLAVTRRHAALLRSEVNKLIVMSSEDCSPQ